MQQLRAISTPLEDHPLGQSTEEQRYAFHERMCKLAKAASIKTSLKDFLDSQIQLRHKAKEIIIISKA
jgi:hypothetical protein